MLFIVFHVVMAMEKPARYGIWIALHIVVLASLLVSEYMHTDWVPDNYRSRSDRFFDMAVSNVAAIIFIFAITRYLRKHLYKERAKAEDHAQAIDEQNQQILAQNQMLEKVNEEKNKIFSIISHDLRSPLDSIRGYLELISEGSATPEEQKFIHEELLNQTKYTSELLLNLLYWSKAQMHGIIVKLVSVPLKELAEEVTNSVFSNAAKKHIKITHSIKTDVEIVADRDMLRIVLRNLLNNSIKFTPEGGDIFVKATRKGDLAEISIQDTGIGIPAGRRDEIFRLKTQSTYGTNQEKGIGLGLVLCQEFIEYQNGRIWFESTEGAGSTFYISLPLTRQ